jgi:hypothetical protein
LADLLRIDAAALDRRLLNGAQQIGGMESGEPPRRRPIGERTASTMTTSRIFDSSSCGNVARGRVRLARARVDR